MPNIEELKKIIENIGKERESSLEKLYEMIKSINQQKPSTNIIEEDTKK